MVDDKSDVNTSTWVRDVKSKAKLLSKQPLRFLLPIFVLG